MYINKGIYTYIPIPDPDPDPDPRSPIPNPDGPGSVKRTNNCSGCCPRQRECSGKIPGDRSALELLAWLSAPWYNNPNNSSGNSEAPGKINPKPDVCLGSPQRLGSNPNNFSAYRPRRYSSPASSAKKTGLGADTQPPQASRLLDGLLTIFRYRILFGFCGIFCGCYVNHAIFSTIHKLLKLFYDLLPAEIVNVFVCYMATSDH